MSDPYREATRHGRSSGMPTFAKVALIVGGLFIVLVTVLVLIGLAVAKRISDEIGNFSEEPAATLANMMEKLGTDVTVVSTNEDEGEVVLRVGSGGELVTVDIAETSEPDQEGGEPDRQAGEPDQEAARVSVRFDGEADESGGILRVDTESGRTTVELRGDEDGGFLDISTPGHEVRFGAGTGSSALPDWVPLYPGAKLSRRQFSAEVDQGSVGGAVFRSDETPGPDLRVVQGGAGRTHHLVQLFRGPKGQGGAGEHRSLGVGGRDARAHAEHQQGRRRRADRAGDRLPVRGAVGGHGRKSPGVFSGDGVRAS